MSLTRINELTSIWPAQRATSRGEAGKKTKVLVAGNHDIVVLQDGAVAPRVCTCGHAAFVDKMIAPWAKPARQMGAVALRDR